MSSFSNSSSLGSSSARPYQNGKSNGWKQNGSGKGRRKEETRVVEEEQLEEMDETQYFEQNRIRQLKDERIHIQKKTFTKWCNSYLNRVGTWPAEGPESPESPG